ncbi:hypothetical protein PF010_g218 [Phytophthora fragariae]|uniref:Uncharacterized protein n=1 Tax=Phytophthora fragariae TaxID=53985 RepID=A0A6A3MTQ7_9STRA|nr:hypothetical protein PF011_g215 [Phytophthora fragariae]KAE9140350.1 hypothetical protein PF010_g218 [Phytophthora fragariae]KAE9155913.1 hypothetical protein PF006_g167 [Phytophthora fragariae]
MASTYPSPRNERWVTPFPLIKDLSGSREDSGAPSDQARVLGIFSPFGGGKGADRERLVCDHREYIDGTRDRDADFGEEAGRNDNASPAPQTPRRRPRMTVAAHKDSSPQPQSTEELVEQDGEAESKSDDDRDEDYNDAAEGIPNNYADDDETGADDKSADAATQSSGESPALSSVPSADGSPVSLPEERAEQTPAAALRAAAEKS